MQETPRTRIQDIMVDSFKKELREFAKKISKTTLHNPKLMDEFMGKITVDKNAWRFSLFYMNVLHQLHQLNTPKARQVIKVLEQVSMGERRVEDAIQILQARCSGVVGIININSHNFNIIGIDSKDFLECIAPSEDRYDKTKEFLNNLPNIMLNNEDQEKCLLNFAGIEPGEKPKEHNIIKFMLVLTLLISLSIALSGFLPAVTAIPYLGGVLATFASICAPLSIGGMAGVSVAGIAAAGVAIGGYAGLKIDEIVKIREHNKDNKSYDKTVESFLKVYGAIVKDLDYMSPIKEVIQFCEDNNITEEEKKSIESLSGLLKNLGDEERSEKLKEILVKKSEVSVDTPRDRYEEFTKSLELALKILNNIQSRKVEGPAR